MLNCRKFWFFEDCFKKSSKSILADFSPCEKIRWIQLWYPFGLKPSKSMRCWQNTFYIFVLICSCFLCKKMCTWNMSPFSTFFGRIERSWGWAHMQSVHACAVQTHFSVFAFFLEKGSLKSQTVVNFGVFFVKNVIFAWKIASQKLL